MATTGPLSSTGVRLGIDLGTATTAAVAACPDGRYLPILIDGTTTMPSGVAVTPEGRLLTGGAARHAAKARPEAYLPDPKRHAGTDHVDIAGQNVAVVDLLAAALAAIAAQATHQTGLPVTSLALAVPPGWGPRRRDVLRQAAKLAGLPEPDLVTDPVAVAWQHTSHGSAAGDATAAGHALTGAAPMPPVGGYLLVADAGAGGCTLSVLQHSPVGFDLLAARLVPECAGPDVDAAIAAYATQRANAADSTVGPVDSTHPSLLAEARRAKEDLWHADTAAIPIPGRDLPVRLDAAALADLTAPLRQRLAAAVKEVIAAADVDPAQIRLALAAGYAARLPGLTDALAEATAAPCALIAFPDTAAAEGALYATAPADPAVLPAWATGPPPPPTRLGRGRTLLAGLVGASSIAVLAQTLASVHVYQRGFESYIPSGYGGFAAAALLAILAATGLAYTVAAAAPAAPSPVAGARLIRQAYTAAAVIGMVVAGLYGLFSVTLLSLVNTPIMRWALLAPLPVAVGALLVGLLAAGIPVSLLPAWLHRIRPQVLPPLLAAAGTLLVQTQLTVARPWYVPSWVYLLGGKAGAAALGAAIALTATRNRTLRMITVPLLGVGAAAVLSLDTATLLVVAYVAATGWAWATAAGITLTAAFPYARSGVTRWLRTLTRSGQPRSSAPASPTQGAAYAPEGPTSHEERPGG